MNDLNDTLDHAADAAKDKIDQTSDKANQKVEAARSYAKEAVDAAGRKMGGARATLDNAVTDVRGYIVDAPFQSMFISMGVGAVLGILRPWKFLSVAAVAGLILQRSGAESAESMLSTDTHFDV